MKLLDFITKLNSCAAKVPNMGHICGGNIYELNEYQNVKYPAFCATQGQHSQEGDWRYYNFTLFYVDRLVSNKRNAVEIQSEAIDVLSNIINEIEYYGIEINGSVLYDVFTERFESECAGAFCTVTFAVMKDDVCPEWYKDPIRKIYYTMEEGRYLEDNAFEITGDARFLYNDKENGVIAFIVMNPKGQVTFNRVKNLTYLKTIDFSEIDTEFRLGEYGKSLTTASRLESIVFPDTLTYLGPISGVFSSVTLPASVTYIENAAFRNCRNLSNVVYKGTAAQWNAIEKGENWHGGERTPLFCSVTCRRGVVELCDKPGCDCSDTGDTCSSDCYYDGVCGSDCSTDTPACTTDGTCTEDNPCGSESICGSDCGSDCSADSHITGDTFGSDLTGLWRLERAWNSTGETLDENAYYVIANDSVHAIGYYDGNKYEPIQKNHVLENGVITDIENWNVFTVENSSSGKTDSGSYSNTFALREKTTGLLLVEDYSDLYYGETGFAINDRIIDATGHFYFNKSAWKQMFALDSSRDFEAKYTGYDSGIKLYKIVPVE